MATSQIASRMFKIGAVHPELDKLVDVAKECLDCGLKLLSHEDSWVILLKLFKNMLKQMASL